jgi:hypothetical protein
MLADRRTGSRLAYPRGWASMTTLTTLATLTRRKMTYCDEMSGV